MKPVTYDVQDDIALIMLTGGVTNPIDLKTLEALDDSLERVYENDSKVSGAILTSSSSKFFSIGFDIPSLLELDREGITLFYDAFNRLLLKLYTLPVPTLSAIPGHCIAAGCIIAGCTDYRIMAEGRGKIGVTAVKLGVHLPHLAEEVLRHCLKKEQADELLSSGDLFDVHWAKRAHYLDEMTQHLTLIHDSQVFLRSVIDGSPEELLKKKAQRSYRIRREYSRIKRVDDRSFIDRWFHGDVQRNLHEAKKKY